MKLRKSKFEDNWRQASLRGRGKKRYLTHKTKLCQSSDLSKSKLSLLRLTGVGALNQVCLPPDAAVCLG